MKKVLLLSYLFSSIVFLSGCNDFENTYEEFIFPNIVEDSDFTPIWLDMSQEDIPFQYGNMSVGVAGGFVWDTPERILFVREGGRSGITLYEYNKAMGIARAFCDDPTCFHDTYSCPIGWVLGDLSFFDGMLSAIRMRQNRDGWISVMDETGRFNFVNGPVSWFIRGYGAFYGATPDMSFARFPDESNDIEILFDEFHYIKPVIIGDYLFASSTTDVVRINLNSDTPEKTSIHLNAISPAAFDGEFIYFSRLVDGSVNMYRSDLNGENIQLVVENMNVHPVSLSFNEDYIFFSRSIDYNLGFHQGGIYKINRHTLEEPIQILELNTSNVFFVYVLPTSPNTLFLTMHDGNIWQQYFVPITGGSFYPIPFI